MRNLSWGRERHVIETQLTHGLQSYGSIRGVSGHNHNPFGGKLCTDIIVYLYWMLNIDLLFVAAITIGPPSETHGEVCQILNSNLFGCLTAMNVAGQRI